MKNKFMSQTISETPMEYTIQMAIIVACLSIFRVQFIYSRFLVSRKTPVSFPHVHWRQNSWTSCSVKQIQDILYLSTHSVQIQLALSFSLLLYEPKRLQYLEWSWDRYIFKITNTRRTIINYAVLP